MAEKPILFNGEMVRAILAGEKTQTRRIVRGSEDCEGMDAVFDRLGVYYRGWWSSDGATQSVDFEPLVQPGDVLWVREGWRKSWIQLTGIGGPAVQYMADLAKRADAINADWQVTDKKWRPSIHMPKWACRIRLNVTTVRVERLQDMNRGDAMAEGCPFANMKDGPDPRDWFADLWQRINGVDAWNANPWVWVYKFKREQQP